MQSTKALGVVTAKLAFGITNLLTALGANQLFSQWGAITELRPWRHGRLLQVLQQCQAFELVVRRFNQHVNRHSPFIGDDHTRAEPENWTL
jgi:hypothetical protein